ncbi:MAG: PilZ domain-containing protein [Sphingomicrobium sp.]|nr:hypothetical protein [Sphingomonadales bacterium]
MQASGEMFEREAERVSIFIAATLYLGHSSSPVRLRNVSRWGAMLQGNASPELDSIVGFGRGRLHATGRVMWADEGRFGVRFAHPICVEDWIAPPKNESQQLADRLFVNRTILKGSANTIPAPSLPTCNAVAANIPDDLGEAIELLTILEDRLAEDMTIVGQHGEVLQNLDRALQILTRMQRSE